MKIHPKYVMRDFNNIKIRFLILSAADISLHYNTKQGRAFRRKYLGCLLGENNSKVNFWENAGKISSACHWRIKVCLVIFFLSLLPSSASSKKNFKLKEKFSFAFTNSIDFSYIQLQRHKRVLCHRRDSYKKVFDLFFIK